MHDTSICEIPSSETDPIVTALRNIFPSVSEITNATPRTFGFAYIITQQMASFDPPTTQDDAIKKIVAELLDDFHRELGVEPRRESFIWRELPIILTTYDFELRAQKVAVWMRFVIDPWPDNVDDLASFIPETSAIKYIT